MKRYCGAADKECEKGKSIYYAWLRAHNLDDTKPYRKPQEGVEAFKWAQPIIKLTKEDKEAKYYKVEALFPISSMNNNVYTEEELIRAARTLVGKPVNLNHEHRLYGVEIIDAEYEDGAIECLLRVEKNAQFNGRKIVELIDQGEIMHVSIEGTCRATEPTPEGKKCEGLILTGLALLTKDVLPGIPLTRIMPVERLVESFNPDEQAQRLCDLCGRVVSDYVLLGNHAVHPNCAKRFWQMAFDIFHFAEAMVKGGKEMQKKEKPEKSAESQEEAENSLCEEKAVASHETPRASEDYAWDADAAEKRIRRWAGGPEKENIDWSKYRQAFAWYNESDPENFGSYKLPHHDIIDGKLKVVWRGVAAAMAALMGARGGVDIPTQDRRAVYNHLARHYRQFEREPPEFTEILLAPIELKIDCLNAKLNKLLESIKTEEEKQDEVINEVKSKDAEELEEKSQEKPETEVDEPAEDDASSNLAEESTKHESTEQLEERKPTKEALIERFKELRRQGYSQRDAWRLVALETIERVCRQNA